MAGYSARVAKDIERWRGEGWIDAATAETLRRDVQSRRRAGLGFGAILAILAALLIGSAILIFVAANWPYLPRVGRVVLLFSIIAGGYVSGAIARNRGSVAFSEALYLVAAFAFGGSIALIGQMYHMSGDEAQAILVWCLGTALAALGLRSPALTAGAVLLGMVWLAMSSSSAWSQAAPPPSWLALAAALWALSIWTRSVPARELLLASLMLYGVLLFAPRESAAVAVGFVLVSCALFIPAALRREATDRLLGLGRGAAARNGLAGFLIGMAMVHWTTADTIGPAVLAALAVFAGTVGALVLAGRGNPRLRWLAYAGFGVELCYVYYRLVGTMLGTAGFFLAVGLILAGFAYAIRRVERRMGSRPDAEAPR